jgi:hypothetical protein
MCICTSVIGLGVRKSNVGGVVGILSKSKQNKYDAIRKLILPSNTTQH